MDIPAFIPVSFSDRAVEEIKAIMQRKAIPMDYGLRVGVRGGGCGVSFIIGFDKPKETDLIYHIHDIPVYVDKKHILFLTGKQVDFIESDEGRGFTFLEENQKTNRN